jgi:threonine/homoserine/homoserine lactone efflux protein
MWDKLKLDSKTSLGLATLLLTVVGLALVGKLTAEAVDAIKWLGGSFMAVRAVANLPANQPKEPPKDE